MEKCKCPDCDSQLHSASAPGDHSYYCTACEMVWDWKDVREAELDRKKADPNGKQIAVLELDTYVKMQPPRAYTVTANIVGIACLPNCAGNDCDGCPASTATKPTDKLIPLSRVLEIVENKAKESRPRNTYWDGRTKEDLEIIEELREEFGQE